MNGSGNGEMSKRRLISQIARCYFHALTEKKEKKRNRNILFNSSFQ